MNPSSPAFDLAPGLYASLVDWPRRLEREAPFFRAQFDAVGARSVLDVACGTGHHAAMFASWGLDVTGIDASPAMIEFCHAEHGTSARLRWQVGRLEEPGQPDARYDEVVCIGNSLSILPSQDAVRLALNEMRRVLKPGGAVVVHVLNLWRLPDGPIQWQKLVQVSADQDASGTIATGDGYLLKGVHRVGDRGFVNVVLHDSAGSPNRQTMSTPLLALDGEQLSSALASAGFAGVTLLGNYAGEPYRWAESADLIAVARCPA